MLNATTITGINFPDSVRSDTYTVHYGRVCGMVKAVSKEDRITDAEISTLSDTALLTLNDMGKAQARTNRRHRSNLPGAIRSNNIRIAREVERRGL